MFEQTKDLSQSEIDAVSGGMVNPPPTYNGFPESFPGSGIYVGPGGEPIVILWGVGL